MGGIKEASKTGVGRGGGGEGGRQRGEIGRRNVVTEECKCYLALLHSYLFAVDRCH